MGTLVKAWIVLVILTLTTMWAGTAQGHLPVLVQVGVILVVSVFKASLILNYFLGLRSASAGWRVLFSIYLVVLGGAIFATVAVGCSLTLNQCTSSFVGAMND